MAFSNIWLQSTQVSANSTSTVAPPIALPENCHTSIIYNPDTTNTVYVKLGVAAAGAISPADAMKIPPVSSLTLGHGTQSKRVWVANEESPVFTTSGGTITVSVSYLCERKR